MQLPQVKPMPFQTACPHCDRKYTLADDKERKTLRCKGCGEAFVAEPSVPQKQKSKSFDAGPARAARKRTPREDAEGRESRPPRQASKRQEKKGGIPLWVWLAGGGGLLAPPIDETTFDKLNGGMSEKEIIGFLGQPTRGCDIKGASDSSGGATTRDLKASAWDKGGNTITVTFEDGKAGVIGGTFVGAGGKTIKRVKTDKPGARWLPVPNKASFAPEPGPGPSKMTVTGTVMLSPARTKSDLEFYTKDDPPTEKVTATEMRGSGVTAKESKECWIWKNGAGFFKLWFDDKGNIVDNAMKDLPG
jgi:hypothetical protein